MTFEELYRHPMAGLRIKAIMSRCGDECCFCAITTLFHAPIGLEHRQATREHLTPVSRGGGKDDANIAISCAKCNGIKGDMNEVEYRFFTEHKIFHATYIFHLEKQRERRLMGVRR